MKALGQRIQRERLDKGLNQTDLANLAGVSLNFVSQLERGKPTVRMDKLLSVLQTLGLELEIGYRKRGNKK